MQSLLYFRHLVTMLFTKLLICFLFLMLCIFFYIMNTMQSSITAGTTNVVFGII